MPRYLPKCKTGLSGSGVCGNRPCCEAQNVECCAACEFRKSCNSVCGWLDAEHSRKDVIK